MLLQTVFHFHDCKDCLVLRVVYCVCVKFECYVYVAVGYYAPRGGGTILLRTCGWRQRMATHARAHWERGPVLQAVWLPVVAWVRMCWGGSGGGLVGQDVLGRSTWACYYTTWCW